MQVFIKRAVYEHSEVLVGKKKGRLHIELERMVVASRREMEVRQERRERGDAAIKLTLEEIAQIFGVDELPGTADDLAFLIEATDELVSKLGKEWLWENRERLWEDYRFIVGEQGSFFISPSLYRQLREHSESSDE
jgi:hypothetical protein